MKSDGHLGRCYLKGRDGDAANLVLSDVGHNLRVILGWLRMQLNLILIALWPLFSVQRAIKSASSRATPNSSGLDLYEMRSLSTRNYACGFANSGGCSGFRDSVTNVLSWPSAPATNVDAI